MTLLLLACSLVPKVEGDTTPLDSTPDSAADSGGDPDPVGDTGDTGLTLAEDDARVRALTDLPEGDAPCAEPLLLRVTYAVDGDTVYGTPDGGGDQVKVRMIGVDTPEIEHDSPADCYGNEAWTYTAHQLENRLVWLTFDAECFDVYGRTLAYVIRDADEAGFYNRHLARNGYAWEMTIAPNDSYSREIRRDVGAAEAEGLGMWAACQ